MIPKHGTLVIMKTLAGLVSTSSTWQASTMCGKVKTLIYSYAVITMDSNATFDWLHHRMPAVLDSGEKIKVLSRCIYYTIHVAYLCSTKVNLQNYTCKSKY